MNLADAKKGFRQIIKGRQARVTDPQRRAGVELALTFLDSRQTAVDAWIVTNVTLMGLADVANGAVGCCTYSVDGTPFTVRTTNDECLTIPGGSFDADLSHC